jgi:hypothetical protein
MADDKKRMLRGHLLSDEELEALRIQVEGFDTIEHLDPEATEIIAQRWPHLLAKVAANKP